MISYTSTTERNNVDSIRDHFLYKRKTSSKNFKDWVFENKTKIKQDLSQIYQKEFSAKQLYTIKLY